jgi:hypothetical protein
VPKALGVLDFAFKINFIKIDTRIRERVFLQPRADELRSQTKKK